ncbi:MAG TPA: addiction module protein [Pirellulaceae bacterium]|nr:addiction module protein [Pirellulaceae bacterium]
MNTASTLAIEALSVSEKLLLMERLWEDLSRSPSDVPPPDWHGDVLAERQAAVREGRTSLVEWEAAKERLRERLK